MVDILAIALGISNDEADEVRKVIHTLSDDVPELTSRVEELEVLLKAIAYYHREENPELWRKSLDDAKKQVAKKNAIIKTTVRK